MAILAALLATNSAAMDSYMAPLSNPVVPDHGKIRTKNRRKAVNGMTVVS